MGRSSTTESEDGFIPTGSPLSNDCDAFSGSSNGGIVLKKGPWTTAEDAILVDYVKNMDKGTGMQFRSIRAFSVWKKLQAMLGEPFKAKYEEMCIYP